MKLYTKESKIEEKELKKLVSRHTEAYTYWEILNRLQNDDTDEIPLDVFLDLIGRDHSWYYTFLNNIRIRLTK